MSSILSNRIRNVFNRAMSRVLIQRYLARDIGFVGPYALGINGAATGKAGGVRLIRGADIGVGNIGFAFRFRTICSRTAFGLVHGMVVQVGYRNTANKQFFS